MTEDLRLIQRHEHIRSLIITINWTIRLTLLLAIAAFVVGAAVQSQLVLLTDSLIITVTLAMLLARLLLAHHNITGVIFLLHIVFDALTITLVFLTPLSLAVIPIYPIMLFTFAALYTKRKLVIWFTGSALFIATVGFGLWLVRYIDQPPLLHAVAMVAVLITQSLSMLVIWQLREQFAHLFERAQQAHSALQQTHAQLEQIVAQRTAELSAVVAVQRATLESTADGICVIDTDDRVLVWNQKFLDLWHIPPELIATQDNQRIMAFVGEQLVTPDILKPLPAIEAQITGGQRDLLLCKDGREVSRHRQIEWINPQRFVSVASFRDMTIWQQTERRTKALAGLSQQLSIATSVAHAAHIIAGVADELLHWDACFFNMYDATTDRMLPIIEYDEIDGQRVEEILHLAPCTPSAMTQRTMREGAQLVTQTSPLDVPMRQFGDIQRASASMMYVPIRHGALAVGVLSIQSYTIDAYTPVDLELLQGLADQCGGALERIRTEAALRQAEGDRLLLERKMLESQKLESLGVLAGGIAHDFNNLLAVIFGNVNLAQLDLEPEHLATPSLRQVEIAARRAADLTHQMLAYAGKSTISTQRIALNSLIQEMDGLLSASLPKHIRVSREFADGLPELDGDATQIRQIVMNLLVNAAESIGERAGSITLRTGLANVSRSDLAVAAIGSEIAEGTYLLIEVADSGCGMDVLTRGRIFDPFFSTKFAGRGLGLAAVLGITRSHHGAILVESEPGTGTIFRVLLPPETKPTAFVAPTADTTNNWVGNGCILVVDDEPSVRHLLCTMLERLGFTTLVASDGQQALACFRANAAAITAVLLDVTMPQMSGQQVVQELRAMQIHVPIILMSGYAEEDARQTIDVGEVTGFLHKPFRLNELRAAMRQAVLANIL